VIYAADVYNPESDSTVETDLYNLRQEIAKLWLALAERAPL
jgi:hypothetical protein